MKYFQNVIQVFDVYAKNFHNLVVIYLSYETEISFESQTHEVNFL